MNDLNRSMKYSMVFGLAGAVILPFLYECYANISHTGALFLIGCWAVFAGIKFSRLPFKSAMLGISACLAYSGVLGMVCYVAMHPAAVRFLTAHSKYFYLSLKEQMYFLLYAALIMVGMYIVCLAKYGVCKAVSRLKDNGRKTAEYIDNAFSDEDKL